MTTAILRDAMRLALAAGLDPTELQWFDISAAIQDQAEVGFAEQIARYRPPFPKCMVVSRGQSAHHAQYDLFMLVVGEDPEEGITIATWKGPTGLRPRSLPLMVYAADGDVVRYGAVDEDARLSEQEAASLLAMVAAWYRHLAAGSQSDQPYVKPTFTNQRKIAAGKPPTYDWHTVKIGAASVTRTTAQACGGTHASPREHDRRGHLRRLRSGKNVWVRPCKVGSPERGAVFKDYQVVVPRAEGAQHAG
jgi:hypothetical protein